MNNWYEVKIKYQKLNDQGVEKPVSEVYLFDAISFTEAESRINLEIGQMVSGDFFIMNIKRSNLTEIFPDETGDRWFKCKVSLITIDESSGKEKKSNMYALVQANDVREAYDNLQNQMRGTQSDYEVPAVSESPILEVFPYFDGDSNQQDEASELEAV